MRLLNSRHRKRKHKKSNPCKEEKDQTSVVRKFYQKRKETDCVYRKEEIFLQGQQQSDQEDLIVKRGSDRANI